MFELKNQEQKGIPDFSPLFKNTPEETARLAELLPLPHYGADEAGRGCLNGPVVVASCKINPDLIPELKDSKQLTEKERGYLFDKIKLLADDYKIIEVSASDIDKMNILKASLLGMREAYLQSERLTTRYFVDGNKFPDEIPGVDVFAVIKGDQRVAAISAASILAKVTRDRIMMDMHTISPWMGYDVHKGYSTKLHLSRIKEHGIDESYRRTFGPVAELLAVSQIKEQDSLF